METLTRLPRAIAAGTRILAAGGPLAASIKGYEVRKQQVEMADLLGRVFHAGGTALVEAGTGIGKSYGYLAPAILCGERVVVSTETIALQQQLADKDLPRLVKILEPELGRRVKFAIAKGRSNYFCVRNAEEEAASFDFDSGSTSVSASDLLTEYRNGMWNGDRATLELPVTELQWSVLGGDDSCQGADCPNASECPYLRAKEEYKDADIIVSNHRMTMLHHRLLQETGFNLLPEHQVWVADEAHTVPDILGDTFGAEIRHNTHASFLKRLERQLRTLKIVVQDHELNKPAILQAATSLFACFRDPAQHAIVLDQLDPETLRDAKERAEKLGNAFFPVLQVLGRLAAEYGTPGYEDEEEARQEPDSELAAIKRLQRGARQLYRGLRDVLETDEELVARGEEEQIGKWVRYVELGHLGRGQAIHEQPVTLHCKPIEVRGLFQKIRETLHATIFTSATLAGGGRTPWKATLRDFGLEHDPVELFQAESPFDYAKQVVGYIPDRSPEPTSDQYPIEMAQEIARILKRTQGRAFVLFTSHRDMQRVYEQIAKLNLPYPLLLQGNASKDQLLRDFKQERGSVLFGCRTFWTGVDIPGNALSAVIIAKLPFPNPSAPLVAARCKVIERSGGSSFNEYSVPACIREIKQGFGRLIRTMDDTGLFAILDGRMRTKRYGHTICSALPDFEIHGDLNNCHLD